MADFTPKIFHAMAHLCGHYDSKNNRWEPGNKENVGDCGFDTREEGLNEDTSDILENLKNAFFSLLILRARDSLELQRKLNPGTKPSIAYVDLKVQLSNIFLHPQEVMKEDNKNELNKDDVEPTGGGIQGILVNRLAYADTLDDTIAAINALESLSGFCASTANVDPIFKEDEIFQALSDYDN